MALGSGAKSYGEHNISILGTIQSGANYAVAIGNSSVVNYSNSIVLGSGAADLCIGDFVVNSGNVSVHEQKFIGQTSVDANIVLTSDGQSPVGNNLPVIFAPGSARMTASVVAIRNDGLPSEAASFILSPTIINRDESGNYTIIGTATFTIEVSTETAVEWAVPTLTINDSNTLYITVTGEDAILDWAAYVRFETL